MGKKYAKSTEEMLKIIDAAADGDCPLDEIGDEQEWLPEHEEHECSVCVARSAYNTISEEIRIGYHHIIELQERSDPDV